jgi:epimerase transport system membrane fusion protein
MLSLASTAPAASPYAKEARDIVRTGIVVLALLVFGIGIWMVITPLSGAVIATALVKIDMNRKTVQHQEGGIVKEVLVRDGSRVKAGDILLLLDDVRVDATNELLRTQLDGDLAKSARLDAERALETSILYPVELTSRASAEPRVSELMAREGAVLASRRNVLDSQEKLLRGQVREAQREAKALSEQVAAEERGLKLQREELAANQELANKGFMSKTRILGFERAVADYESRRGEHQAALAQARQRAGDFELRIASLRNEYMQKATDELKETTARSYDLRERLRPSMDAALRQKVVAPVEGEVVDLKVTAAGAIIAPREALMDIVPINPELIVEARVRPEDILYVRAGGEADVRLTAFKSRSTPVVTGQVVYVSADRLTDPASKVTYYLARVKLTPQALKEAGDLQLQAGMPAEVFIRTPERTPMQYLLEPVSGFMQKSFREP